MVISEDLLRHSVPVTYYYKRSFFVVQRAIGVMQVNIHHLCMVHLEMAQWFHIQR